MTLRPIDRLTDAQIDELVDLYQTVWWAKGRTRSEVETMLAHSSLVFAFEDAEGRLTAFSRVLTDAVYKAIIFDVIVRESHRDQGIGRLLMERILAHPTIRGVRHVELYCRPALAPFYAKWGFTDDLGVLRFMRRDQSSM